MPGPASNVLALVDGSDDHRAAALAGADLFASTPGLSFTVLAPAEVAQPSGAPSPASVNGSPSGSGLLLRREQATASLMETVRGIEDRGLTTKLRTIEGSLAKELPEIAAAHDLVILPPSRAALAEKLPVPALVAP